ncbi:hypothetical protein TRFO_42754 [Tritrichomonas foetus]|uniref:Uncharacterized protein n=1 Tax=Tritrichomonas foetus TaxID=1144522 RepID=A0A1J4KZI7_9EUKA|nr:hypothetical protein TRFO_42754 [Tritrichomonas foetus]|eukprot:OHT15005.1 hypothetical protein TRFO_42754 [Tritrichomonas foetus]
MRHEKGSAHNKKLKQSGVKAKKVSTETKIQKTNEVIKKDDKSNLLNNLPFWINSPNSIFARSFNQVSDCSHHENQFPVDLFDNLTGNGISQCEPKIESSGFDSSFEENSPIETSYETDVKSDTDEHYEKEKKNLNESESDPEIGMIIWEDWHISVPEVEKHQITTNKYLEWY